MTWVIFKVTYPTPVMIYVFSLNRDRAMKDRWSKNCEVNEKKRETSGKKLFAFVRFHLTSLRWEQKPLTVQHNADTQSSLYGACNSVPSLHTHWDRDCVTDDLLNCVRITNADITPGVCSCPAGRAPQRAAITPRMECRFLLQNIKAASYTT